MIKSRDLIPIRFMLTMGHFITTCMLYYSMEKNVRASFRDPDAIPASSEIFIQQRDSMTLYWYLSLICFGLDWLGVVGGFSLFFLKVNFLQVLCQFGGSLITTWMIRHSLHWGYFKYVFYGCHIPTFAAEVMSIIYVFGLKAVPY